MPPELVGEYRRPCVFGPSQWHELCAVVWQATLADERGARARRVLLAAAWVDGVLVARLGCGVGRARGGCAGGVQLAAFFGGKTAEWAAPADCSVSMADLAVLCGPEEGVPRRDDGGDSGNSGEERVLSQCPLPVVSVLPSRRRRPLLVFCAGPGRNGTAYLSKLLGSVSCSSNTQNIHAELALPNTGRACALQCSGVVATHEPQPDMAGEVGLLSARCTALSTYELRKAAKLPALLAAIEALPEGAVAYVETNHTFISSWCAPPVPLPSRWAALALTQRNQVRCGDSRTGLGVSSSGRRPPAVPAGVPCLSHGAGTHAAAAARRRAREDRLAVQHRKSASARVCALLSCVSTATDAIRCHHYCTALLQRGRLLRTHWSLRWRPRASSPKRTC